MKNIKYLTKFDPISKIGMDIEKIYTKNREIMQQNQI